MRLVLSWLILGAALAVSPGSLAADPPRKANRYKGADALAKVIDNHIQAAWKKGKVQPAAPASDAEFLRRVYLDLAGRIPSVTEARKFLGDKRSDKRTRLVEKLLAGPRYATHLSQVWRALLLPEATSSIAVRFQVPEFERWLFAGLRGDRGYDAMVRDLLTQPMDQRQGRQFLIGGGRTPSAFYTAKEFKPEELASAASKIFLGVNIGCAQCHKHPFAAWKREQFWSLAAFFSGIQSRRQGDFAVAQRDVPDRHEIEIPGTDKTVKATFLDGKKPTINKGDNARKILAEWMTSKENPYFAKATVNRLWAHLFGIGLIDPLDEMGGTDNPASHPELLNVLAKAFAEHKFDLKFLFRAIIASKTYQLTSRHTHDSQKDPRHFAKAPVRGLTAEQLYDSIVQATGYREDNGGRRAIFLGGGTGRSEFLTKFAGTDRPTDVQTSILQALSLMNGGVVRAATSLKNSETLLAVVDAPFLTTKGKIETLFLSTLSRTPTAKELKRFIAYVDTDETKTSNKEKAQQEALADVLWVLLNSSEFFLNH